MIRNLLEKAAALSPVAVLGFWLPAERRRRVERWLRGWEQRQKLARADAVIVSFGKSGRTWVRVLLSRFYQLCYGLRRAALLGFDNLHRKNARIPRIFLTHDNYIQDYSGDLRQQARLLRQARDPAGAQPAGHRGVAVLPVEVPHAPAQEGAERLPGRTAPRSRSTTSSMGQAGPAEDHRLHEPVGARARAAFATC